MTNEYTNEYKCYDVPNWFCPWFVFVLTAWDTDESQVSMASSWLGRGPSTLCGLTSVCVCVPRDKYGRIARYSGYDDYDYCRLERPRFDSAWSQE